MALGVVAGLDAIEAGSSTMFSVSSGTAVELCCFLLTLCDALIGVIDSSLPFKVGISSFSSSIADTRLLNLAFSRAPEAEVPSSIVHQ